MLIKKAVVFSLSLAALVYLPLAKAMLDIELTKGVASAVPIAVVPFKDANAAPTDVSQVVAADLANSGQFNVLPEDKINAFPITSAQVDSALWRKTNVNDVVVGNIEPFGYDNYKVTFSLVDVYAKTSTNDGVLLTQSYTVNKNQLRALSHHISDEVYQQLTGERGVFSTRLAYVLVDRESGRGARYQLQVSDIDGFNAKPILTSSQPVMSPSWSPDGRQIAYVSFESFLPQIYVSDVATGKRKLITSFSGINGAPNWSPDGKKLAVALSQGGNNPNIFILDLATDHLKQITHDLAINTEPSWAPDGQSLIFTSDRGGSPQVYQVNLASGQEQRLTYDGNYNATASYTADGKNIVLLHRGSDNFNVAVMNLATGEIKDLTNTGKNQSPSVAPNGKMVVFASEHGSQGVLGVVSTNGNVSLRIPDQNGSVQEPAWSPFLS